MNFPLFITFAIETFSNCSFEQWIHNINVHMIVNKQNSGKILKKQN